MIQRQLILLSAILMLGGCGGGGSVVKNSDTTPPPTGPGQAEGVWRGDIIVNPSISQLSIALINDAGELHFFVVDGVAFHAVGSLTSFDPQPTDPSTGESIAVVFGSLDIYENGLFSRTEDYRGTLKVTYETDGITVSDTVLAKELIIDLADGLTIDIFAEDLPGINDPDVLTGSWEAIDPNVPGFTFNTFAGRLDIGEPSLGLRPGEFSGNIDLFVIGLSCTASGFFSDGGDLVLNAAAFLDCGSGGDFTVFGLAVYTAAGPDITLAFEVPGIPTAAWATLSPAP